MTKIEEAQEILKAVGMPSKQYNEISALTLLALCGIGGEDSWADCTKSRQTLSKGLMSFIEIKYHKTYAPNSRESIRRQVLHQFVQARLVDHNPDNPHLPVNSSLNHYAISSEFLKVLKSYGTESWTYCLNDFILNVGRLSEVYLKERKLNMVPVKLPNGEIGKLSPGKHNELQAAIVEKFGPRFTNGGTLLYLGDTANKAFYVDEDTLNSLGIPITQHSKLPDVIIHDTDRNWLFLIEAVTSHGPVSPKRMLELEELLDECNVGKVYVTAFVDISEFNKHSKDIAWETEVWLMDIPDHMIHFNGDRFMGPR